MEIILAALAFTFVLWKVSAFLSEHPPKITLPRSAPIRGREETPKERYHRNLQKLRSLPLDEDEYTILLEAARKQYIQDSWDS